MTDPDYPPLFPEPKKRAFHIDQLRAMPAIDHSGYIEAMREFRAAYIAAEIEHGGPVSVEFKFTRKE